MRGTAWRTALRGYPVHGLGLIAALAYAALALFTRTAAGPSLSAFFSTVGVATLAMFAAWCWDRSSSLPLGSIVGWALVFRTIGFLGGAAE